MSTVRKQVPSKLSIFNTFNNTYFNYFYGHLVKHAKHINNSNTESILDSFTENHFYKLDYSLIRFESFLLWLFSKYGKLPLVTIFGHIDEFLKEKDSKKTIQSFSINMSKYMRDNNISNWKDYILSKDGFYPKIIQHYMKDKNIPFEVLLFLKVFDNIPQQQKKSVKSLFRKEMYTLGERIELMNKNKTFIINELRKVMESLNG
jgi:hypothetical protein